MSDLDLDQLLPSIEDLKKRNSKLEDALRQIQNVLNTPSNSNERPNDNQETVNRADNSNKSKKSGKKSKKNDKNDNKKKKKKKKKQKTTTTENRKKFVWCGKEGTFDAYRCKTCSSIIREDKIDKHRCLSHNKNRKRKGDKILEKDGPKKRKVTNTTTPKTTVSAAVNATPVIVAEPIVTATIANPIVSLEEDDIDHPLYRGLIDGWTWQEYRYGYSCYKCNKCGIVMRHDYINRHDSVCRARNNYIVKQEVNEAGISLL